MNNKVKIFGVRMSLIGDCIMSLPILDHLKTIYPNSYIYFSLAKKCQQAKFLFENHPNIDEVKISDYEEELGPSDFEIIKNCDLFINPRPPQPSEVGQQYWYNERNCVEQAFTMGQQNLVNLKTKPKVYLSKELNKIPKSIAVWPLAGYGSGFNRGPSKVWWENLLLNFPDHEIHQFGHTSDFVLNNKNVKLNTSDNFENQIYKSLGCSIILGTDSGSMWATGAFNLTPQINFLTNWLPNHNKNFLSLAPEGEKCVNFFSKFSCDNINILEVTRKINELLNL